MHSMQNNQNRNGACAHADASTKKMALVAAAVFLVILAEVWLVSFFVGVAAFPNGAPVSSCADRTPFHGARLTGFAIEEILDKPAPYVLKTNRIDPHLYKGVISGAIPFRAFMVQARIDGLQQIVGKFIRFDTANTKTLSCSQNDDTITHTNDKPKQQITFIWHVNDLKIPESRIHFVATVAKSYSEFWTNVTSEAITIGSPIREMTATTPTAKKNSVPEGRLSPGNPEKLQSNTQGNQKIHRQRRQQWDEPQEGDRPFLEREELLLPPEIAALVPQLPPIQSSDSWQHLTFIPGQPQAPTRRMEPKTTPAQKSFDSQLNSSIGQKDRNVTVETVVSRPRPDGRKTHPSTAQPHWQHITEISRTTRQTTPGSVDKTRISMSSRGASNNSSLSLPLYAVFFTLILFLK